MNKIILTSIFLLNACEFSLPKSKFGNNNLQRGLTAAPNEQLNTGEVPEAIDDALAIDENVIVDEDVTIESFLENQTAHSELDTNALDEVATEEEPDESPASSASSTPTQVSSAAPVTSASSSTPTAAPVVVSATASYNFSGKYGLVAIHKAETPMISALQAKTGFISDYKTAFITVYKKSVTVNAGDILRLRLQIEMTNDTSTPVAGSVMITANGTQISAIYSENVVVDQVHHLPYWADATYHATTSGTVLFEAKAAAFRTDSSPILTVNGAGYGHLNIEQYTPVNSENFLNSYGIVDTLSNKSAAVSTFGSQAYYFYPITSISKTAEAGDVFSLVGQTMSVYQNYDMHGSALWANGKQISPWATQNHAWNTAYNPNYLAALYTAETAGTFNFNSTMHTAIGTVNGVGASHILGLQFRKLSNETLNTAKFLKTAYEIGIPTAFQVASNAGWHNVQTEVITLKAGDVVRIRGQKQFLYPSAKNPVYCQSQVIVNSGSNSISASTTSQKYMNDQMESMPLHNDDLFVAPISGGYAIYSQALCASKKAQPVTISNASISVDIYGN